MMNRRKPELLAPAGDLEKLKVAVLYGADAVYLGGDAYGLLAKAKNFKHEAMAEGIQFAHQKNKKVYVATFLRLIVLPVFFIGFLMILGADPKTLTLALFAFGTPLGLNTVVFPAAYGGDTSTGASMAMISHTLCIITIPLLYVILTSII